MFPPGDKMTARFVITQPASLREKRSSSPLVLTCSDAGTCWCGLDHMELEANYQVQPGFASRNMRGKG